MPTRTTESQTDAERRALEPAVASVRGTTRFAHDAPRGTALAACEPLALTAGRPPLRDTPATALRARADAPDAPKKRPAPAPRGGPPAGS